jgi:hypothetical protein
VPRIRLPLLAIACAIVLVADAVIPSAVNALQVRPNELALQRPFIERHIEATRSSYGLNRRARESEFTARKEAPIDFKRNASMLDNVRLWDWRAFHDTLSQSQPLRPYTYADTDVDRYRIGGQLRRELRVAKMEVEILKRAAATGADLWHAVVEINTRAAKARLPYFMPLH